MDFVVKNTEKTDEKMRKQESKFKQLEALTTGMINPIKNCSIKPNHWKAKHGLGRERAGLDVLQIHAAGRTAAMLLPWPSSTKPATCSPSLPNSPSSFLCGSLRPRLNLRRLT